MLLNDRIAATGIADVLFSAEVDVVVVVVVVDDDDYDDAAATEATASKALAFVRFNGVAIYTRGA